MWGRVLSFGSCQRKGHPSIPSSPKAKLCLNSDSEGPGSTSCPRTQRFLSDRPWGTLLAVLCRLGGGAGSPGRDLRAGTEGPPVPSAGGWHTQTLCRGDGRVVKGSLSLCDLSGEMRGS